MRRHLTVLAVASVTVLLFAVAASAHDFWLVPETFRIAPGDTAVILGQTSSHFPTSESAVAPERLARAEWIGVHGRERMTRTAHRGQSLVLRHRARSAGQYVAAVVLHPRSVRESAEGFRRYLEAEGAAHVRAELERAGQLPARDSVTRRYAKYAKTLVEVGTNGPRGYHVVAGHPLEFVPGSDPARASARDTLAVRLLYHGQPLGNVRVHADVASGIHTAVNSTAAKERTFVTDSAGWVRVPLDRAGIWNVRTIHIVRAPAGSGADWDTHWATLVFHVAERDGGRPPTTAADDSVMVVQTVERYHRALQQGDSATALELLLPTAVILESGGLESREEYRSHHLPADIEFAKAIQGERSPVRVVVRGNVAWATSTSTTQGTFRGRAINSSGAELMVLERTPAGWRIAAIHWSSRNRRS